MRFDNKMLLKSGSIAGDSADDRSKKPGAGLVATGTTTTVSSSHGKSFRNGESLLLIIISEYFNPQSI